MNSDIRVNSFFYIDYFFYIILYFNKLYIELFFLTIKIVHFVKITIEIFYVTNVFESFCLSSFPSISPAFFPAF